MIDLAFWLRVSGHLSILFWLTQVVKYGEVLDTYEDISDGKYWSFEACSCYSS